MADDIISKISELNLNGYYDHSNGHVTVWFHNNTTDKNDVVAYLKANMSWDVREVVAEQSEILTNKEVITITHKPLSIEEPGSTFDSLVRKMIDSMIENDDNEIPESITKMKEILDNNSYGVMILN